MANAIKPSAAIIPYSSGSGTAVREPESWTLSTRQVPEPLSAPNPYRRNSIPDANVSNAELSNVVWLARVAVSSGTENKERSAEKPSKLDRTDQLRIPVPERRSSMAKLVKVIW